MGDFFSRKGYIFPFFFNFFFEKFLKGDPPPQQKGLGVFFFFCKLTQNWGEGPQKNFLIFRGGGETLFKKKETRWEEGFD